MIPWLLSLFAEHRALQADRDRLRESLQSATNQALMLQDRLDSAMADRDKLWGMTQECLSQERAAYHMQINQEWQRRGFGVPYPDAPKLPPNAIPAEGGESLGFRPELPSTGVARATNEFIQQFRKH